LSSKLQNLKYETAKEIGLIPNADQQSYKQYIENQIAAQGVQDGSELKAYQAGKIGGKIGGNMVRKMIKYAENNLQ
jgi:hypothetical protein